MTIKELWDILRAEVFGISSTNTIFNQYNSNIPNIDLSNAKYIRRKNLKKYLDSFRINPNVLIVGEAPGYKGCRFSGIPFTSEYQLCECTVPFTGTKSSCSSKPYKEITATIFWNVMSKYHPAFFVWNCIPFHPHEKNKILSNRTPKRAEIIKFSGILSSVVTSLNPEKIIAVGRKPQRALKRIGFSSSYVRHPSRGGASKFKRDIEKLFCK